MVSMYVYLAYSEISKKILKTVIMRKLPENNIIDLSDETFDSPKLIDRLRGINVLITISNLEDPAELNRLWKVGAATSRCNVVSTAFLLYNEEKLSELKENDAFYQNMRKMYNVTDIIGFINQTALTKRMSQKKAETFIAKYILRFIGGYTKRSAAGLLSVSERLFFKNANVLNISFYMSRVKRYKLEKLEREMVNLGFWDYKNEYFTDAYVTITMDQKFKQSAYDKIIEQIRRMFKVDNFIWSIETLKTDIINIQITYGKKLSFRELINILTKENPI